MKARVKATGEIIEVIAVSDYINGNGQIIGEYKDADGMLYNSYDLDFYIEEGITIPDYWTRLEHQYAGMAMQGLMTILPNIGGLEGRTPKETWFFSKKNRVCTLSVPLVHPFMFYNEMAIWAFCAFWEKRKKFSQP